MSKEPKAKFNDSSKKELIKTFIIIAVVIGATFGGYYILKAAMGTDIPIVVVSSPSMEPNINEGDLLFVKYKDPAEIKSGTHEDIQGDVIIYETTGLWSSPASAPVVHRVINKWNVDGTWYFQAQGDNNDDPDPPGSPVTVDIPEDHIYGVVVGRIPAIGWIKIVLTESQMAIPIMVILAILLVISIVYDISHPEEDEKDKEKKRKNHDAANHKKDEEFDLGI